MRRTVTAAAALFLVTGAAAQTAPPGTGLSAVARQGKGSGLDPDKVRCVKTPIIGTLAQFHRTCMTNREWDRTRNEIQRMRDPSTCASGQCTGG